MKLLITLSLLLSVVLAYSQHVKTDTAVVKSYGGIQVFYHCKPLHPYWVLGKEKGKATVNHTSQAFARYASEAEYNYPGCTGIIINDVSFLEDHYEVIRTLQIAGYHDTAVFENNIFMSAKPTRPYEIVDSMHLRPSWLSLQNNLQDLFTKAHESKTACDGIIVEDMDFGFGKSNVLVFRWKKNEVLGSIMKDE